MIFMKKIKNKTLIIFILYYSSVGNNESEGRIIQVFGDMYSVKRASLVVQQ